ncbi:RNA polymerase III Rpc [Babesia caballi]|uniref:RNA polymerase III Rpc n=1 Tax=Babesia caballi TaxID=5871 RepID=A0AAV4LSE7_BABCB|nr:RNA polymerase III Rpc [Babesia caballi]
MRKTHLQGYANVVGGESGQTLDDEKGERVHVLASPVEAVLGTLIQHKVPERNGAGVGRQQQLALGGGGVLLSLETLVVVPHRVNFEHDAEQLERGRLVEPQRLRLDDGGELHAVLDCARDADARGDVVDDVLILVERTVELAVAVEGGEAGEVEAVDRFLNLPVVD